MFTLERSTHIGPRGGRNLGYCLAWQGSGDAPGGRARRSGWYKYRPDAEQARDAANRHARELAERPTVEPERLNDGKFLVVLLSPDKSERVWLCYGPHSPDGQEAIRFETREAANARGNASIYGEPKAFWNSERQSAENTRRRMRGWTFEIVGG